MGELSEIDSRTSDAIAMAVRFECPIFTYDFILETAGVIMEDGESGGDGVPVPATAYVDNVALAPGACYSGRDQFDRALGNPHQPVVVRIGPELRPARQMRRLAQRAEPISGDRVARSRRQRSAECGQIMREPDVGRWGADRRHDDAAMTHNKAKVFDPDQ